MTSRTLKSPLVALALFAASSAVVWGQGADSKGESPAAAAKEQARSEVDSAKERVNAQRDATLAEFEALARQLKDANAEQRKQILARIEEKKKTFEEAQSALHKQIREDQRRRRQNAAPNRR